MRSGGFLRWAAHPLTVAATAVLLLNDHVFKQAWPGLVTGKLSDVAGMVVAPPVLALLLGLLLADRIAAPAAVLLTGAGFALVKLTPAGAEVASAAWSVINGPSVVLADPTDLIALPALGLAWWAWLLVAAAPPLPPGPVSRFRVAIALPFAVLAITATSPPSDYFPSIDSVRGADEAGTQVVIEASGQSYSSRSGVDDWTLLPQTPPAQPPERRLQTESCAPDDAAHCYRVHGGGELDLSESPPRGGRLLGVDETTDGGQTWHTAWEVPAARWPFVLRQHTYPGGLGRPSRTASVEVLVRAVPGGHEVFVANGVEGLAVRGADGAWRRVPVVVTATELDLRPVPLTAFGRAIGNEISSAGLITLFALLIGMAVAAGRARARLGRGLAEVLVPLGLLVLAAVPLTGLMGYFFANTDATAGPGLVLTLLLVGGAAGLAMAQGVLRRSRTAVVIAAAVLTGLAFVGPVFGWTVSHPPELGSAVTLGLLLAAGCLPLVAAAGWWAGRDPVQRPAPVEPGWPPLPQ